MYFKLFLIDKILSGDKTQTRRLVKQGQGWASDADDKPIKSLVIDHNGRCIYMVGKDYAVCPGRGKPVIWHAVTATSDPISWERKPDHWPDARPLRIVITSIRQSNPLDISEDDARAEGFPDREEFLARWDIINGKGKRQSAVWVLTFEVHHEQ